MIFDLDRLRMEYAKSYQVDEGSAGREPLAAKSFRLRNKSDHKAAQSYKCKPAQ